MRFLTIIKRKTGRIPRQKSSLQPQAVATCNDRSDLQFYSFRHPPVHKNKVKSERCPYFPGCIAHILKLPVGRFTAPHPHTAIRVD